MDVEEALNKVVDLQALLANAKGTKEAGDEFRPGKQISEHEIQLGMQISEAKGVLNRLCLINYLVNDSNKRQPRDEASTEHYGCEEGLCAECTRLASPYSTA